MCNLYSITKGQAAIGAFTRAMRDRRGNLPPMPGVFPDYPAPIVRNALDGVPRAHQRTVRTKNRILFRPSHARNPRRGGIMLFPQCTAFVIELWRSVGTNDHEITACLDPEVVPVV
jgi:hypothetical protein